MPTNLMDRTMGGRLHTTLSLLSDSPTILRLSHIERHSWHSVSTGNQMAEGVNFGNVQLFGESKAPSRRKHL